MYRKRKVFLGRECRVQSTYPDVMSRLAGFTSEQSWFRQFGQDLEVSVIDAMGGVAPPATGQTTLPPSYQPALLPGIGADWVP